MYREAIAELEAAIQISGNRVSWLAWLGHTYGVSGRRTEALKVLEEVKALFDREGFSRMLAGDMLAVVYEGLGDLKSAVSWLEKIYGEPSCDNFHFLRSPYLHDPRFDRLRADARFQALLKRVGFSPPPAGGN